MIINTLKALMHNGHQAIDKIRNARLPDRFRGLPEILKEDQGPEVKEVASLCPTGAITLNPLTLDLGLCTFCGLCREMKPEVFHFSNNYLMATNSEEGLKIRHGKAFTGIVPEMVREEVHRLFGRSLRLRQISAAGDNACEAELNASGNINFDLPRYGIDFVASPRHADGVLITGPISENMAFATEETYRAVPDPKIVILCGTAAISGGLFRGSPAVNRNFLGKYPVDLYIPGNPPHPLTIVNALYDLIRTKQKSTD